MTCKVISFLLNTKHFTLPIIYYLSNLTILILPQNKSFFLKSHSLPHLYHSFFHLIYNIYNQKVGNFHEATKGLTNRKSVTFQ